MSKFSVPVLCEMTGFITVEASSKAEALEKAKKVFEERGPNAALELADQSVDFASGDDLEEISEEE